MDRVTSQRSTTPEALRGLLYPGVYNPDLRECLAATEQRGLEILYEPRQMHLFEGLKGFSELTGRQSFVRVGSQTLVQLPEMLREVEPGIFTALRNLGGGSGRRGRAIPAEEIDYLGARLLTTDERVLSLARAQVERAKGLVAQDWAQFANSAYYMGSKKSLAFFLVETLQPVVGRRELVVDLMCGSGAASGAFARFWQVLASDAQEFCPLLAKVQGRGLTSTDADGILAAMLPKVRRHVQDLYSRVSYWVDWESRLFHGGFDVEVLEEYNRFCSELPTFPGASCRKGWDPVMEVEHRQKGGAYALPWCLFTAYFSNVFFGLRQALEIDSLRFAVEHLRDPRYRDWALGALIATVSSVATTYGGHFAQPLEVGERNFRDIIERRARSVINEFAVRLRSLALESQRALFPVEITRGPWEEVLPRLGRCSAGRTGIVYLDAPYRREEYSRYYHVLETLVRYDYPAAIGKGRLPDKAKGERFRSGFFTRSRDRLAKEFVRVIGGILAQGWDCAWSYCDDGDVSIARVVKGVLQQQAARVDVRAAPSAFKAQGGRPSKEVTEFMVLFQKRD